MRVKVAVKCGDVSADFMLHCGDGKKTIKWLALTASQRFSSRGPRGAQRCREKRQQVLQHSHYLPSNVFTSNQSSLMPNCYIEDVLHDDDEVVVELAPKVAVCSLGSPELSTWAVLAFAKTENQRKMHDRAQAIHAVDEEEARFQQKDQNQLENAHKLAEKASLMRNVLEKQIRNEHKRRLETQEEWKKILDQRLIDRILTNENDEEKSKIYELLEENFYYLSALFRHFCALGAGFAAHTIQFHEFTTIVYELNIFKTKPSHHLLHKVFTGSSEKGRTSTSTLIELHLHEFFVAILRLAVERNAPTTRMLKISHPVHVLFKMLLEDTIVPFVDRKIQGAAINSLFSSNEILALFYDYNLELIKVFEKYAVVVEDDPTLGILERETLNVSEFQILLHDAGLLGRQREMSFKDLRQVFATSQTRMSNEFLSEGVSESTIIHEDQQMDYPEYLEALARVALLTNLNQEDSSSFTKVENVLKRVSALAENPKF